MKFGFGEARLCANVNSLDIWREDKAMIFLSERSNSEDYAPEIATQKINMNIATLSQYEAPGS